MRRGQAMVLFALTVMLLAVMVCVTLSIAMKTREKIETQTLADAAAYSTAVATARTYNEVAMISRAQVAQMVSMAATQSAISFSSAYLAALKATNRAYAIPQFAIYLPLIIACCIPFSPCMAMCQCATRAFQDIQQTRSDLDDAYDSGEQDMDSADQMAAMQVQGIQGAAAMLGMQQVQSVQGLFDLMANQKLANDIVGRADKGGWVSAPAGGEMVALQQVGRTLDIPEDITAHQVHAAMGSRGEEFVTDRKMGSIQLMMRVMMAVNTLPDLNLYLNVKGSAYFASDKTHADEVSSEQSWADDHGNVFIMFLRMTGPCPPGPGFSSYTAHVKSTADGSDEHEWTGGSDDDPSRHQLFSLNPQKPGIWPIFVDWKYDDLVTNPDPTDYFGSPLVMAAVQRDYQQKPNADPWNLFFRFRFVPSGGSEGLFDNREQGDGIVLRDGTNISKQTAIGSALVYYHRLGEGNRRYQEPPNLLNPFWRATLVGGDMKPGLIAQELGAVGDSNGAAVAAGLEGMGYRAW